MQIVFLFYDGMTALDAVGPHEILCRIPNSNVKRAAKTSGPIKTCSGLILMADYKLSDISSADILVVPGAKSATTLNQYPEIHEWLKGIHHTTTWTTSVCTGSLILGAAGLLQGLKATSHWAVLDRLKQYGAKPTHARVVEDGKVMTAAGVSAGIDMALTLCAKIGGPTLAQTLQLAMEYDPAPPFDSGSPEKADPKIRESLQIKMNTFFE